MMMKWWGSIDHCIVSDLKPVAHIMESSNDIDLVSPVSKTWISYSNIVPIFLKFDKLLVFMHIDNHSYIITFSKYGTIILSIVKIILFSICWIIANSIWNLPWILSFEQSLIFFPTPYQKIISVLKIKVDDCCSIWDYWVRRNDTWPCSCINLIVRFHILTSNIQWVKVRHLKGIVFQIPLGWSTHKNNH